MGCNELFGQFMPRGFKTIPADLGSYAISHYFLTTLIRRLPVFERGRLVRGGESARWLAWDGGDEPEASRPEALSGLPTAGLSVSRLCQHCLLDPSEEARIGFPRGIVPVCGLNAHSDHFMVSSTRIPAPVLLTTSLSADWRQVQRAGQLVSCSRFPAGRVRSVRGWWTRRSTGRTRERSFSPFYPRARAWPSDWPGGRGCQRSREGGGLRAIVR